MALNDYDPIFQAAGKEWNVDPTLLKAVAQQESGGNPRSVSTVGAKGVMQIMDATGRGLGVTDPYDPAQSIYGGAKYMSQMLDKYNSVPKALAAYNAGPGTVDASLASGQPLPAETQAYVPAVASHYARFAAAGKQAQPAAAAAPQQFANDPFSNALKAASQPPAPDPFSAALGSAQPAQAPANDPFSAALGAAQQQTAPPAPDPAAPSTMDKIAGGLTRAAHDLTDAPAELLAKGADAVGLTGLLNKIGITAPTADQTAAADKAGADQYQKTYGDSNIAGGARVVGQVAGTLPVLMSGAGLAGGASDVAAAGAARVSPMLGDAIAAGSRFVGGTLPGNILTRGASLAANGATLGAAAAGLTAGQSDAPIGDQMLAGAKSGAILGPVASVAGAGLRGTFNALTGMGGGVTPEVAQLAQTARNQYGIPVTAPQMGGNSLVRIANDQSSKLPFSGAAGSTAAQQDAWQQAVSRTFGENTPRITPDVMQRAATRIGGVFDDVAKRTTIQADQPLLADLGRIQAESQQTLPAATQAPINAQLGNILEAAANGGGAISGSSYQALTRAGTPLSRAMQDGDPNVRFYAGQVKDALDNAFQRSAAPADQGALAQARGQYRAMKTIEDLVEKSPDGNLSPALLMGQVRSASSRFDPSTGGMAYTGGGQLGDLARIGQQFLKPQPNSGTADRLLVNSLLGGGGVAAALSNPLSALAVPAGLMANRLGGAYLRSGGYADRIINSSLNNAPNQIVNQLGQMALPTGAVGANALMQPNR